MNLLPVITKQDTTCKDIITKKGNDYGQQVTYIDRKSYGIEHGLKGAALDRAHKAYRRAMGLDLNAAHADLLARGGALCQKVKPTANGFVSTFVWPDRLEVKAKAAGKAQPTEAELEAVGAALWKMPLAEFRVMMAARKAELAKETAAK